MQTFLALVLLLPLQIAPDGASVRSLVRELDAPQKAVRDAAEQKLIDLGPAVLGMLPRLKQNDSAELALRLDRIRLALLRVRAAANLHGSKVTLAVKDKPLAEVLAEIERQTDDKLIDYRRQFGQQSDDIPVTLDVRDLPFWETIDRLGEVTGLEPYHFAHEDGLALIARTAASPSTAAYVRYDGAFRVQAKKLTISRSLVAANSDLQIELEAAWEPRLRPLFITVRMAKFTAVDDADQTIAPSNPDAVLEIPPQGRASKVDVKLSFAGPPRSVRAVKSLRGTFDVLLPAEMHTFRFEQLGEREKQEQRAAAATVTLDSSKTGNGRVEATLRLRYDRPANALESHRAWFYKNPAFLEGPDGTKIPPGTIELIRQADDELTLRLLFPAPEDVSRHVLVYQTPADLVALPVEFEFRDLPLP